MASESEDDDYHSSQDEDFKVADIAAGSGSDDQGDGDGHSGRKRKRRRTRAAAPTAGGRPGGLLLMAGDEDEEEAPKPAEPTETPEERRARLDKLLAEELGIAAPKPKPKAPPSGQAAQQAKSLSGLSMAQLMKRGTKKKAGSGKLAFKMPTSRKPAAAAAAASAPKPAAAEATPPTSESVTITETYDFAGEVVTRQKVVPKDSKEAKAFAAKQQREEAAAATKPSALQGLLQTVSKKRGMNVLTKSQIDWDEYKHKEGIEGELAQNRADGYLGQVEFLQRADQRQFELEKQARAAARAQKPSS